MPDNASQSSDSSSNKPSDDNIERIPGMQSLLDNPFLLLFIGVATPAVFYLMWGIMEIVAIPVAP
jgi:hypothetical protein